MNSVTRNNPSMGRAFSMAMLLLLIGAAGCKNFFTPINGTGTGTTTPVVNTGNYAYVVNNGTVRTLSGFSISTAGTLTALTGFPVTLPFVPTSVAVTGTNAFLYVAGAGVLYGYTINADGTLTQLQSNGSFALVNVNIAAMDASPDGNWLVALDAQTSIPTIDFYKIDQSTGQLTVETAVQPTLTGGAAIVPNSIRVSPKGDYVAIALGTAGDVMYSFDTTTGAFTLPVTLDTGSVSAADQALAFDAASSALYIARSGTRAGVYSWTIASSNGQSTLTPVVGAPFLLGPATTTSGDAIAYGPASMVLDSTGTYLYVGNRTVSSISGFSIAAGGVLSPLAGSPYTAGTTIDALVRDNSGKYVLSANLNGNPADISLYNFDATALGQLDILSTASTGDPTEPAVAVAIAVTH